MSLNPESGPLVEAVAVSRRHPLSTEWLLDGIDLAVDAGERLSLIGATGSGKSLILRALALLDPIDQGEIRWRQRPIPDQDVPHYRSAVLYLPQNPPVIEGTVEDNLRLPFTWHRSHDRSFSRPRAVELLERVDRGEAFLDARSAILSGGERQLVALIRALLVGPTVLLLDEPSAALDRDTTGRLERLLARWFETEPESRGWIWVSHDRDQAGRMSDRVLEVRDGSLVTPK